MQKTNQQGFTPTAIIIAIIAVLIVGVVIWRVYDATQQPKQNNTQTNTQSPDNQQPQTDPNAGYVVIPEWGVRFKAVEGLEGVQPYKMPSTEGEYFSFTTDVLAKADPNCAVTSGHIVLATLMRGTEASGVGKAYGPINGYYYYSRGSSAACSQSPNELEGPIKTLLLRSLESLEAAK